MASFSSRGSDRLSSDIIKPDVTAPGVNILAGNTPTALLGSPGELFQSISGTSMSSPHVAGLFALLKQVNPDWSAAMAKSALMTTARQDVTKEDGTTDADPFDMGAGHVDPSEKANKGSMFEPGLAYDAGLFEYAAFTCGADLGVFSPGTCAFLASIGVPMDPSDLNIASIGVGELVGSQTVQRTVTSVAKESGWRTYSVSVDAPEGFEVTVSPTSFALKNGMSLTYEVTITNDGSALIGEWSFGSLRLWDLAGHYEVRSPIAARAFELDAPAEIHGSGDSGSADFNVKHGFNGEVSATTHALSMAIETDGNVVDDPANNINVALGTGVGITVHQIIVAPGSVYARFNLFDAFVSGEPDLDLYVFGPNGFVGGSGSGTSEEQVDTAFPAPGIYDVIVHGWQTDGPDTDYTLFSFIVGADPGSNLTVSGYPSTATVGLTSTVTVSWTGLSSGTKYLGAVVHYAGSDVLAITVVSVEA
ncbi:MAG: Minor extracellular protease vpr precursor [Candidatus Heimdallarchaeota archaeon LC_2]|nr:MAG: Minor extracellular protease vpr precursor [Candidatus Heimdallarchaeota archaeon LC_2]